MPLTPTLLLGTLHVCPPVLPSLQAASIARRPGTTHSACLPLLLPAGLAVIFVMTLDTSLLAIVMLTAWEWSAWGVGAFWLFFTFITSAYLSSNLEKVPKGAWFRCVLTGATCLWATALVLVNGRSPAASTSQSWDSVVLPPFTSLALPDVWAGSLGTETGPFRPCRAC